MKQFRFICLAFSKFLPKIYFLCGSQFAIILMVKERGGKQVVAVSLNVALSLNNERNA
jgi:hypothetical protein